MTDQLFALLERLHGHLAVLALAVTLHPVISLGRRKRVTRGTRWASGLAAGLLVAAYAGGWWLYPHYREQVRPGLELETALMFERKEHLAFLTVVLGVAGGLVLAGRPSAWRMARSLFLAAWLCGLGTATLGLWVASHG